MTAGASRGGHHDPAGDPAWAGQGSNGLFNGGGWDFYIAGAPHRSGHAPADQGPGDATTRNVWQSVIGPKLFDDKVPTFEEFRYNGQKGGDKWRLKVRGYWLSKCLQLLSILTFVEHSEGRVTRQSLQPFIQGVAGTCMTDMSEKDLITSNAVIYGFLNTATYGDADDIMMSVPELEGFEAWRMLCRHIDSGRAIRLDALRRKMRRPAMIRNVAEVPSGVLQFSNLYREFLEAGVETLKQALKSDLYESLPSACEIKCHGTRFR